MSRAGRISIALAASVGAALAVHALLASLPGEARLVAAIGASGVVLWLSEALPLHVTAIGVTILLVAVAGYEPETVFAAYFDPVVVLLLGGFALGRALERHRLDALFSAIVLSIAGTRPRVVLLGLMTLTATISMWMSNTATAAVVLPVALSVLAGASIPVRAPFAKAMVLGVAYSASLGGLATPVGSPPNALAVRFLGDHGRAPSFGEWMLDMVPVSIVLVLGAWLILVLLHRMPAGRLPPAAPPTRPNARQWGVMAVFGATVAMWIAEPLHGIDIATVALLPVVVLFATGLLEDEDFGRFGWPVLVLMGGSIALGDAVRASGIDGAAASAFVGLARGVPAIVLFSLVALAAMGLTVFLSNSAAAVVIVPPLLPVADALGVPAQPLVLAAVVGVSADLLVPVGTPPNALAYATGHVRTRDLLVAGTPIALLAIVVAALAARFYW